MSMDFLFLQCRLRCLSHFSCWFLSLSSPRASGHSGLLDSSEDVKSWPAHLPLSVAATSNIFRCAGAVRVE